MTAFEPSPYPPGITVIRFVANDRFGQVISATTTVTVVDTTPPAFVHVVSLVGAEATGPAGAVVVLPLPVVFDAVDPAPRIASDAPAVFPLGQTVVVWTATDAGGNSSTAETTVMISDMTPPVITRFDVAQSWACGTHEEDAVLTLATAVQATDLVDPAPRCLVMSASCHLPAEEDDRHNGDEHGGREHEGEDGEQDEEDREHDLMVVVGAASVSVTLHEEEHGRLPSCTISAACVDFSGNVVSAQKTVTAVGRIPHCDDDRDHEHDDP